MKTDTLRRRVDALDKRKGESLSVVVTIGMNEAEAQEAIEAKRRRVDDLGKRATLIIIDR